MTQPTESPRSRLLRRSAIAVAVLAALGLIVLAGFMTRTGGDDTLAGGGAVESLSPERSSSVLRQSTVSIDLATGWTGELVLNGIAIPDEQLQRDESLNVISYQPGAGKVIETLEAGENCATATIWPIAEGPGTAAQRSVVWCWTVL